MKHLTVLAVDLGAESGRVMAVHFDGQTLKVEELHRFPSTAVTLNGTLYWDFLRLWHDLQEGIEKGKSLNPASIGVAAWGVDFGLLDAQGQLIGNPVHHRDSRTEGMIERVLARVPQAEIFAQTGIQFMPINTLFQIMSLVEKQSPQLTIAAAFLTVPDLFNYWLTGVKVCEFTNATTTQMFNPRTCTWAIPLLEKLDIPPHIFPEIVQPGTRLGEYKGIPVIVPACHDTGSAVAAVPVRTPHYAYVSSGTWSLVGLEVTEPLINPAAMAANATNEGGVYGTYRLLKDVIGMWTIQQARSTWARQGSLYSYSELVEMALAAPALNSLINPNASVFLPPGNQPQRIQEYCRETGQPVPDTKGAIIRSVLESLALKYRQVIEMLSELSGQPVEVIHIVGGGAQNELLNQMTANATGLPVVTGPIEATVLGNALVQLISLGALKDIQEARQMVAASIPLKQYDPQEPAVWAEAYHRFQKLPQQDWLQMS